MQKYKINCVKYCSQSEYGIDAFVDDILIKSFESISDDKAIIQQLANLCNELDVELCHIEDIIEDYLTDFRL